MRRTYSLREAREYAGLTREQVAASIGCSSKTIERWEAANSVRIAVARQIAALCELDVDVLRFKRAPARSSS